MAFVTAPDFKISAMDWTLDRPAQINVSAWTGRRTVVSDPWHGKWRASIELAPVRDEENARLLRSFLVRCRGSINTFRVYATAGNQNANSGVTVAATAAAGATTMTISGATTPLTDGQMFTVNDQLCVCTADQSGTTLTFEPPLREDAPAGTTVHTDRPYALVHMANAQLGYGVVPGPLFGISFDVEEALLERHVFSPADLFTSSELGAWYDPSDLSTLYQTGTRASPGAAAAVGNPVGLMLDKSGNQKDATQTTAAKRPILRQTAGGEYYLEFDGVDDAIVLPSLAALSTGSSAVAALQTTDTAWLFLSRLASGTINLGVAQDGNAGALSSSSGSPAFTVNRAALATNNRDGLHDAMSSANPKILSIQSIDFTLYDVARLGDYGTFEFVGKNFGLIIHEGLDAAQLADVEDYLAGKSAVAL